MTESLPEVVYTLCALTSLLCAILVARAWRRTGKRMLLLIALCFAGLAANNLLLVVDLLFIADVNLSLTRASIGAVATGGFMLVLIWEGR